MVNDCKQDHLIEIFLKLYIFTAIVRFHILPTYDSNRDVRDIDLTFRMDQAKR